MDNGQWTMDNGQWTMDKADILQPVDQWTMENEDSRIKQYLIHHTVIHNALFYNSPCLPTGKSEATHRQARMKIHTGAGINSMESMELTNTTANMDLALERKT
jgi:hypothetical protein